MPAPKGQITLSRGPFAGQTFPSYYAYQNARAVAQGFSGYTRGPNPEKTAIHDPMFKVLEARMRSVGGTSAGTARNTVRQFMATQSHSGSGARKHNAIRWGMDQGLWDDGDDAADEVPY